MTMTFAFRSTSEFCLSALPPVVFANAFAAGATTSAANNARGVMSLAFTIPPANAVAMRPAPRKPMVCFSAMRIH